MIIFVWLNIMVLSGDNTLRGSIFMNIWQGCNPDPEIARNPAKILPPFYTIESYNSGIYL